jgi:hypothetical protein
MRRRPVEHGTAVLFAGGKQPGRPLAVSENGVAACAYLRNANLDVSRSFAQSVNVAWIGSLSNRVAAVGNWPIRHGEFGDAPPRCVVGKGHYAPDSLTEGVNRVRNHQSTGLALTSRRVSASECDRVEGSGISWATWSIGS